MSTDYITVDGLKSYLGDQSNFDVTVMQAAVTSASRRVETICGRTFNQDAAVSDKYFFPGSWWDCDFLDTAGQRFDLGTTTSMAVHVDMAYNGAYSTALTLNTDFFLEPVNGTRFGQPWPYEKMVALSNAGAAFPIAAPGFRPTVKVTGIWGWPAVPDDVVQATYLLAAGVFKRKDAPMGIIPGFIDSMGSAVKVRDDPLVFSMLEPYVRTSRWVA